MQAARLHAYGEPLTLEEVPRPVPGPGQVVVKVEAAGFCHSDLHVIDGELQILPHLPVTLGHENAGIVSDVGAGVRDFREGDPVAVYGAWGCGLCDYCVGGVEQLCVRPEWVGLSDNDGGYAEFMRVKHERHLVKLGRLTPREAAALTDAALTPYRAVKKAAPLLEPDQIALVIGLGGLGLYGVKLLHALSGCQIIVVDLDESKRKLGLGYGATHALDGRDPELRLKILELTGGLGVSAAFDFVGSDATLELAVATTKALGKVTQLGLAGGSAKLRVLANTRFEVSFEATLWGTIRELREVVALAENGRLSPIPTEYQPLAEIQAVARRLRNGQVQGRAVITP
jgi:propanol-preferring alcohol dehydrogenase